MVLEKKNFIIDYDDSLLYITDVVNYLESRMSDIINFFELNMLDKKIKIIVYNDLELYKKHIEKHTEYYDYMCADTYDGNINLLSLEVAHKTKEHCNMTIDYLKGVILHEFVHICQKESEIESLGRAIAWFWEALATNLGNPDGKKKVVIKATNHEIEDFNSLNQNYSIAFTIGNYMLENYSHDEILDYVRYPKKLLNDSNNILDSARVWSNNIKYKK